MGKTSSRIQIHPVVFVVSAGLILVFVCLSLLFREEALAVFTSLKDGIVSRAGWFFILTVNAVLLFCVFVGLSKYGRIRLGGDDCRPSFGYVPWLAMLFSAGMGIGLVFWSVAEPIYHLGAPPLANIESNSPRSADWALAFTYFHWGLHAWGIYGMVGLALAFFGFNRGLPFTIRSTFYPILGARIHGPLGNLVDISAVVATLFGVATSLGFGAQQVNAGLNHLFAVEQSPQVQVWLIIGITAVASVSVILGLDKGIKRLSQFNMGVAAFLLIAVGILGPTITLLNGFVQNVGTYVQQFIFLSFWTDTYLKSGWREGWTIFYWAWWIAWSPFVGMFIGRISRGRTIREFLVGVLLVPTALTFLWLSVFGNTALNLALEGNGKIAEAVSNDISTSLFAVLAELPLTSVTSLLGIIVIITFFVTSSDSGSLVIDIITAGGNLNPPVWQRIFWAFMEGAVAATLLLVGGNDSLTALQTATIVTGLPFAFALVAMGFSLHKGLECERKR